MAWQFFGRGQTPSQKLLDLLNDDQVGVDCRDTRENDRRLTCTTVLLQVVAEICQLPLESLTQGHRYRLRRIYSHWFNLEAIQGDEHEQEGIGDDPAAVRARPRKRRRRTQGERHSASPDTRNPLQRIMNLRVLVVHPEIQAHIHRFRADASAFWNEHSALQLHTMGPNAVFTMTDQFIDCYHYTNSLDARASLDRLRWCFQMMFFSDLVHYIHPTGSGHRPGLLMMEHLQGMLGSVGASGMPLDSAGVLIHLREWSNQGQSLVS